MTLLFTGDISGNYYYLEFDVIHLGNIFWRAIRRTITSSARVTNMALAPNPFVGYLENINFNGVQLIDRWALSSQ